MSAPDVNAVVRARFEAWHDHRWPEPDNCRHKVDWRSAKHAKWTVWQAAHADLSGEVRELVEAADEALDALHAHGVSEKCRAWIPSRDSTALNGLRAALAKFTHQEKP